MERVGDDHGRVGAQVVEVRAARVRLRGGELGDDLRANVCQRSNSSASARRPAARIAGAGADRLAHFADRLGAARAASSDRDSRHSFAGGNSRIRQRRERRIAELGRDPAPKALVGARRRRFGFAWRASAAGSRQVTRTKACAPARSGPARNRDWRCRGGDVLIGRLALVGVADDTVDHRRSQIGRRAAILPCQAQRQAALTSSSSSMMRSSTRLRSRPASARACRSPPPGSCDA